MRPTPSKLSWTAVRWTLVIVVIVAGAATYLKWWPPLSRMIDATLAAQRPVTSVDPDGHDHPHDHSGHDHLDHEPVSSERTDQNSLKLTRQAAMNLGLTREFLRPVELSDYSRSLTVPAVVVAKPGRSSIVVSSPLSGVVTHVHAVTGEAVKPGELLFEVRLVYEDLVESQTEYLKTVNELEIENREIARLDKVTQSGAISGKLLLERRYAKEKLEASAKAQREALRMHGLSVRQIDEIESTGKLLGELEIVAPDIDTHDHTEMLRLSEVPAHAATFKLSAPVASSDDKHSSTILVIDDLKVHKGQGINAGERLCSLSDYSQLFIEGKAFENDIAAINDAAKHGWPVDAVVTSSSGRETIGGLKLAYVSNSIDAESRTLSMFVELPNAIVRDETNDEGQRFLAWKYRLGQRLELQVPVEVWKQQIVLPIDAVAKDGADWYVFEKKDSSFTRVAVHVQYRDQDNAVIANDGSIMPGAIIARKSAHQMQMALKNLSGGAVDAHAGHNH